MTKLAFCDYRNMVAILEKTEHNTDFHQIVDFLQASHIRYALTVSPTVYVSHIRQFWSTASIETADGETNILAKINGKQRTISESSIRRHLKLNDEEGISTLPDNELFENLSLMVFESKKTYNFSKMIFDGMMRNVKSKGKFLMYPRFIEKLLKMSQFGTIKHSAIYPVPFQTQKVFTTLRVNSPSFSGRTVPLFDTMIVQQGEGSENQLEPHHTPSTQHVSPPHPTHTSSPHEIQSTPPEAQTTPQASLPHTTNIPSHTPTPRRMTKRAIRISQSKALSPVADETAPPTRGDRYGEAFPTATSLDAGQDRENIPKTSAMPHESFPRVTSLGGDEGSLKQKLKELMEFCTTLQSQQTQMAKKIQSQDLEIKQLKARIQTLEDAQKPREGVQEDAPNRGGIDQGEVNMFKGDAEKDSSRSTDKGSESTGDLANVLSSMGAANILASGGLKEVFTTASPQVPPVSSNVSTAIVTASEKDPTAEVLTTARDTTPYTRRPRASRGVVIRSTSPIPISIPSVGRKTRRKGKEIKQNQRKLLNFMLKEDLRQMINELDRSNVMINKHMAEYEEVENILTIEEKTELITELINYQNDFARIKDTKAQQKMLH
ncbi:hypothetical protein Tco_1055807 [Tanacetum coccineum]|uniref:Xylulose kinase-1 n=1 Tax=Tanacetum coccineum TaxID=301880 RepID=A0ABQ5H244_9ASTR